MTGPNERQTDYRTLADFRYEIRPYVNFSEQAARATGTEPQQHQALLAIKGLPPGDKGNRWSACRAATNAAYQCRRAE